MSALKIVSRCGSHLRCNYLFALLLARTEVSSVAAHDFWVQPNEFWMMPQTETPFTLQVGHGKSRARSPIRVNRIVRFEAIAPYGEATDLRSALHLGGPSGDGDLCFQTPGIYVLVLETDNRAQSHLPAIRFNDYLIAEGLTPAL